MCLIHKEIGFTELTDICESVSKAGGTDLEPAEFSRFEALCKSVLGTDAIHLDDFKVDSENGRVTIFLSVTPEADNICPKCGRRCSGYDTPHESRIWKGSSWGGTEVYIIAKTHRIVCPEHGVIVAKVPWAYHGSAFTREFELKIAYKAKHSSIDGISKEVGIKWKTVHNIIKRVWEHNEPDRASRYIGLKAIGVDEVSYKVGQEYITVLINHDTKEIIDVAIGHSKETLDSMLAKIPQDIRENIEFVSGDGAKWIQASMHEFLPNAVFCVDPFHVVEWANEKLSQVRISECREAQSELKELKDERKKIKSKIEVAKKKKDSEEIDRLEDILDLLDNAINNLQKAVDALKGGLYPLGKNPENLTDKQKEKLDIILKNFPNVKLAYKRKEELRKIFKLDSGAEAELELKSWIRRVKNSKEEKFIELAEKIGRHKKNIVNSVEYGYNNGRVEAMNNNTKSLIRRSRGFRNIQNLMDLMMFTGTKKFDHVLCKNIERHTHRSWRQYKVI